MGLTASGKSTQAKRIAHFYGLKHYCGSVDLLRRLNHNDSNKSHWWFNEEGQNIELERDQADVDLEVDERLLEIANTEDDYIFESWTTPFLYGRNDAIKIYLNPPLESRSKMAWNSKIEKSLSIESLVNGIKNKDTKSRDRFAKLYGIDIFSTIGFQIVLDNSLLAQAQTSLILLQYISFFQKHQ